MYKYKWWSTSLILIPFISILVLLLRSNGIQTFFASNQLEESIKNSVGIVGWIFGGIMSLLGFLTIFIAFTYENKLLKASKIKQQLLRPYALNLSEIINKLSEYSLYTRRDFIINIIYWIFLIVSSSSVIIWGIIIAFYTNFDFSLSVINQNKVINYVLLLLWILFTLFLLSILVMINFIRFNKDPLAEGYLLDGFELSDIESLKRNKADLQELYYKITPTLILMKNPNYLPDKISYKLELSIHFPVKLLNIRFVVVLYKQQSDDISIRVFGVLKNLNKLGESFSTIIADDINIIGDSINEKTTGVIKFYDREDNLISLLKLKVEENEEGMSIKASEKVDLNLITRDVDYKDIEKRDEEFIDYTI
ncbi:hypothetical protein ACIQYS_15855 [Psychrobacillus sp. NPDC096426]|uniref:hypothetical protein n=1 Tax=Psychrobacillus sp. NPDC096426 TaxID=3364491 RepID=UPI003810021C